MGSSLTWVAVRGATRSEVLALLELKTTEEFGEYPRAKMSIAELRAGWTLLLGDSCNSIIATSKRLEALRQASDVVVTRIEEHVMFSQSEHWQQGQLVWRISHQGDSDVRHLIHEGALPKEFDRIKSEHLVAQANEESFPQEYPVDHVFDIPIELARTIVDFRYDDWSEESLLGKFEVLSAQNQRAWWAFWR